MDSVGVVVRALRTRHREIEGEIRLGELVIEGAGHSQLDYDLGAWHLGLIATGERAEHAIKDLATGTQRRLLSVPQSSERAWAWLGGEHRPAPGEIERVIAGPLASAGVTFALGEPARDIQGWRLTHEQAQAALVVARHRPRLLTRYADVALLAAALKDQALARALLEIYLSPLEGSDDRGAVLRETLRAYLAAERNASSAAAALGVTRKTIENRLEAIEERLGRTLHPCPVEIEVALHLHELGCASAGDSSVLGE